MRIRTNKYFILFFLLISIFFGPCVVMAEESIDDKKDKLEAELQVLEKEIAEKEALLKKQQSQTGSLKKEVTVLTTQIQKAKLSIQAKNIEITKLKKEIDSKTGIIGRLDVRLSASMEYLRETIRRLNENEESSIAEMALSAKSFSDFYLDVDTLSSVKENLRIHIEGIEGTKEVIEKEKNILNRKQNAEADAKVELENIKKKNEQNEKEKNRLLGISKNQEYEYQKIIKEREVKAAQIRAALFALRDAKAIPFGEALTYAEFASSKTGVRPALILAIIQQESNMGENVGTCNRTGDSHAKNWKTIMPGPIHYANYVANKKSCNGASSPCSYRDDQSAFVRITQELGIPQEGTPLSCPWGSGGWGGAMGPSQFIPTTWELFKEKISSALGIRTPDPWNPKHAITATSVYLKDLGAGKGGYTAERNAACRYYSGRDCDNKQPANSFYGDQVVAKANNIQNNMIDLLKNM